MLGTTCYFTTINGGKYSQVQAKEVEATAFLRCVDDGDLQKDLEKVKKIAAKYKIDLQDGGMLNIISLPTQSSLPIAS